VVTKRHYARFNYSEFVIRVSADPRIGVFERGSELESEIDVWPGRRDASREEFQWMFTCEKARKKMRHTYAQNQSDPMTYLSLREQVKVMEPSSTRLGSRSTPMCRDCPRGR
jgi:hypothetical protein